MAIVEEPLRWPQANNKPRLREHAMKQALAGTRPRQRAEANLDGAINYWQQNEQIMIFLDVVLL